MLSAARSIAIANKVKDFIQKPFRKLLAKRTGNTVRVGKLVPEPGHLPFGVAPGGLLARRNRRLQGGLAADTADEFAQAERLGRRQARVDAESGESLRFRDSTMLDHRPEARIARRIELYAIGRQHERHRSFVLGHGPVR